MTPNDIQRALKLVALLLDGAEADPVFRADLPLAAAKLKYLARLPELSWARSDLFSQVRALKARWTKLYFGESEEATSMQPIPESHASGRSLDRRMGLWSSDEEARCLALLSSDLGKFLFVTFGRVRQEAHAADGRWLVSISPELVCDAEALRGQPGVSTDMFERAYAIASDGVLMWAAANGLARRACLALAEALAPACYELFVTNEPAFVIQSVAERLVIEGLLREGPSGSEREVMFTPTRKGLERSKAALAACYSSRIGARGIKISDQVDDDIPF